LKKEKNEDKLKNLHGFGDVCSVSADRMFVCTLLQLWLKASSEFHSLFFGDKTTTLYIKRFFG